MFDSKKTVLEMLEEHTLTMPDSRAVVSEPGISLTFRELWTLSGRIYARLKQMGIGPEDVVMYCLPRGVELYACIVGTMRAGAAFVLTETGNDQKRTDHIRKDCACKLYVDEACFDRILDTDPIEGYEPVCLHNLCYIAYTSGTTDDPKGVLHEYGSLENARMSMRINGEPLNTKGDTFLLMSPMNFVSLPIVFSAASYDGYTVAIMPYSYLEAEGGVDEYLDKTGVNCGYMTPSFLRRHFPFSYPWRMCILSSEPADGLYIPDMKCYNCYASTESGCLLSVYELKEAMTPAPVGRSQSGIELFILDENEMEVPAGTAGEICYRNPYVRGYLSLPERTRKLLRGRIFHSGDEGLINGSGDLIIRGRTDEMFKIGGYRIEPGEIAGAIRKVCDLQHFVVRGFVYKEISSIIVFYTDDLEVDPVKMRERLIKYLPEYMIPTNYIRLGDFPLLETGKLDRLSLVPPEGSWDSFRKIRAAALPVIGKGRMSVVYDLGDKKVLKLIRPSSPFTMIRQELVLTHAARGEGLPVPDAYEIVRSGASYGIIMDRIEGRVLEDVIRSDPKRCREHIRIFAKALKELHAIRAKNSSFPNIKEVSVSLTGQLDPGFCSEDEADKIRAVFECIPDTDCFVHGDCHTGNAILLEGKISFIDMLLCGKGHPVFDLLGMYSHYVFLPTFISDEQCRQQLGLDKTHAKDLFELFIGEYYPSVPDKERSELIGQIMGVHAARIFLASVILPGAFPADVLSEAKKRAVAFSGRYCNDDRKNRLFSGVS